MIKYLKKLLFLIFFFFFSEVTYSQFNSIGFGLSGGIGQIKSVSPSLTSFTGSIFIEAEPIITKDVSFRLSFFYARKLEYFLPEDRRNRYFPFMKGISLRAVIQQPLNEKFYIDEGAGFIYLNDRVFNDINAWDLGFVIHLLFGMHLKIPHTSGFEIGIGGEYGGTVTNTKAGYSSIYFQIKYKLVN